MLAYEPFLDVQAALMKIFGSRPDVAMSDAAPLMQQNVGMVEPVAVALNNANDDIVEEVEDKKRKTIAIHKFS